MTSPRIVCVIPARLASTRLPEKILFPIKGKALLEHTWRAASRVSLFDEVVIALDDPQVAQLVDSFGGTYIYTSPACPSGTHRIIEATNKASHLTADIWINWQADEPLVTDRMIHDLVSNAATLSSPQMWTLKTLITDPLEVHNPNIVKVVTDAHNRALYFSRSPIPYYRDADSTTVQTYYKHIGLYGYTTAALQTIATMPPCSLAESENLEQLQFLSHNIPIVVNRTESAVQSIDTHSDVDALTQLL